MPNQKATVLTVDDDANLQEVLKTYLEEDGYKVIGAGSGAQLDTIDTNFDVVLLDLMLPDSEGLSLIHKIRAKSKAPIIIVSGKSDTTEKIVGLEMGADDYITKPFEMRELSARIKAVLRRARDIAPITAASAANGAEGKNMKVTFGSGWCLDRAQYQLFDPKGKSADLTTGEFQLLEALVTSAGRVLSREHLFELTRGGNYDVYDRAIDIQIARVRKKLGDDPKSADMIKTIRGVGYMFTNEIDK